MGCTVVESEQWDCEKLYQPSKIYHIMVIFVDLVIFGHLLRSSLLLEFESDDLNLKFVGDNYAGV